MSHKTFCVYFFFLLVKLMLLRWCHGVGGGCDTGLGACVKRVRNLDEQRDKSFAIVVCAFVPAQFHERLDEAPVTLGVNLFATTTVSFSKRSKSTPRSGVDFEIYFTF
jgi:hypothetical protein